jgi:hypothetical protein
MKLSVFQRVFTQNVAKFINYANSQNVGLTFGEAFRTKFQQDEYVRQGLSKTHNSKHLERLAVDFNYFENGVYGISDEKIKLLATYWESLHPNNVAGFFWGWDAGHIEMRTSKRAVRK